MKIMHFLCFNESRSGFQNTSIATRLAIGVGLLLLVVAAKAEEQILDPFALPITKTPWAAGSSLLIPQFDPLLGTLQSVSLKVTGRNKSFGILANNSDFDESAFVTVESALEVTIPNQQPLQLLVTGISASEDIPAGETTASPTAIGSRTKTFSFAEGLSAFVGTNSLHLDLSEHTTTLLTGPSSVHYLSPRNSAGIGFIVTYTYSLQTRLEFVSQTLSQDGTSIEFTVAAKAQSRCRLESIPALRELAQPWELVTEKIVPASGLTVFTVENQERIGEKFFRAVIP